MFTKAATTRSTILIVLSAFILIVFAHGRAEAQAPPNSTFCANDFEKCRFDGEREVIYGARGTFVRKVLKGGAICSPETFGIADPLPNVLKSCYIANPVDIFTNRQEVGKLEEQKPDNRTLTFKNFGGVTATLNVYKAKTYASNDAPVKSIKWVDAGNAETVRFGGDIPLTTELDVEITMKVLNGFSTSDITIYRATVPSLASILCFEVSGTTYDASVKTCNNTVATEKDYITVKNEAGLLAYAKWDYTDGTPAGNNAKKSARTDDMLLGAIRKVYVPRDASSASRTLTINGAAVAYPMFTKEFASDTKLSGCYRVWGDAAVPKVSACSITPGSRTIRFWNNSAEIVQLEVTYDNTEVLKTGQLIVTQAESLEIPPSKTTSPIKVNIQRVNGDGTVNKVLKSINVPYSFKGELCYKLEGGLDDGAFSTCDDVVGDTSGDVRKIKFRNDSGFDAEMIVTYFQNELMNGVSIPLSKSITTGMLTGLGKVRTVAIPVTTSKGMPVVVSFKASATVKNDVWSTILLGDFTDNPQPCFKVWGTLFSPQGGKCDP